MLRNLLVVTGCILVLSGCEDLTEMQMKANGLIGADAAQARAMFGEPTSVSPDTSNPGGSIMYWHAIRRKPGQQFVQTGSVYTGSVEVGETQGGNGVASEPVFQDEYAPAGYYQGVNWICTLTLEVDQRNIIVSAKTEGQDACD